MALLKDSNGIGVEIKFTGYLYGYIDYGFRFLYGDAPLLNPAITHRDVFSCDEHDKDWLIPFFERLLESDQPDEWDSLEPDVGIEARPRQKIGWTDYQSGRTNLDYVSPREGEKMKKRDAQRAENPMISTISPFLSMRASSNPCLAWSPAPLSAKGLASG